MDGVNAFKARVDEAVDWGHEHGFPIAVVRDSNGFWMVSATLSDAHGSFRAECYLNTLLDMRTALDQAAASVRADRKKAFAGRVPGHLPTPEWKHNWILFRVQRLRLAIL